MDKPVGKGGSEIDELSPEIVPRASLSFAQPPGLMSWVSNGLLLFSTGGSPCQNPLPQSNSLCRDEMERENVMSPEVAWDIYMYGIRSASEMMLAM